LAQRAVAPFLAKACLSSLESAISCLRLALLPLIAVLRSSSG
jgi:hypothetical protein